MVEKIIIDCDPGLDDALALILAAGSPEIDLVAVTTVAGNQTLDKVTENARAVAAVAGIAAPIAAGASLPLVRDQVTAGEIHGETGMDGPQRPTQLPELDPRNGVDLIIETILSNEPGTVTLVPIGPLTNIALALRLEPRIIERTKRVILMGGSYTRGNHTPTAEFNILVDPEAAAAVFEAPWDVTMVGLDLTHQATAEPEDRERIAAIDSPVARFVSDSLDFYAETVAQFGHTAPALHDPCCVAAVIDPSILESKDAFVGVELTGTYSYGQTVTDFAGQLGQPLRHHVPVRIDRERFWEFMLTAIQRLSGQEDPR